MDILSHGIWGSLYAKAVNPKLDKPIKLRWAFWWGVFPDLFAFVPVFAWSIIRVIRGLPLAIHRPLTEIEPWTPGFDNLSDVTQFLYQLSHSLIVFAIVAVVLYAVRRRAFWTIIPWMMHILMDIPTHSYKFYATPFLWPLSGWKFNGISWGQWWFMILNYFVIVVLFLILHARNFNKSGKTL